jgi:hypothetical protein
MWQLETVVGAAGSKCGSLKQYQVSSLRKILKSTLLPLTLLHLHVKSRAVGVNRGELNQMWRKGVPT